MEWAIAVIWFAVLAAIIGIPAIVGIWSRQWMMNVISAELIILITGFIFLKNPVEGVLLVIIYLALGVDKLIAKIKKAKKAES